ncbi:MAG: hypothetical protein R3B46_04575 [Phycisphaerales bacterium]
MIRNRCPKCGRKADLWEQTAGLAFWYRWNCQGCGVRLRTRNEARPVVVVVVFLVFVATLLAAIASNGSVGKWLLGGGAVLVALVLNALFLDYVALVAPTVPGSAESNQHPRWWHARIRCVNCSRWMHRRGFGVIHPWLCPHCGVCQRVNRTRLILLMVSALGLFGVIWITAILVGGKNGPSLPVLLLAVPLPALFQNVIGDRTILMPPHGCAKCHYDLRGIESDKCPECGTEIEGRA